METTSRKAVAHSKPRNRAKMRPVSRSGRSLSPIQNNHKPIHPIRTQGVKSLAYMQETISKAFGMFFETVDNVNVSFVSDGSVMTVTCIADGLSASITMSETENMKGGMQS